MDRAAGVTTVHDNYGDSETMKNEAVIHLTLMRFMPKDIYYAISKPESCVRYTVEETLRLTLQHGTWRPWDD